MAMLGRSELPDFHPLTVIRDWKHGEAFRIVHATSGVMAFGATGSGKSSGIFKHLAIGYMLQDFGGVLLCSKGSDRSDFVGYAREAGRLDDLVFIEAGGGNMFNPLEWEASRAGGGGLSINLVALLDELSSNLQGAPRHEGGSGENRFFDDALHHMNANLVELPLLAGYRITMPLLRDILHCAPTTLAQAKSPDWQEDETNLCAAILKAADAATRNGDPDRRAAFEECRSFWTIEFPALHERVKSVVILMFSVLARPFVTPPLRTLFALETTIVPEDTFDGKIIIVDLPVQDYRLAGRLANLIWKYCFQLAVMRRKPAPAGQYLRPVFLFADEAQMFVSRFDAEYQAVARSAGGCTVYLTQNRESLRRVMGDNDAVDALLGNLSNKFFCQNSSIDTNEFASQMFGEHWVKVGSHTSGLDGAQHTGAQSRGSVNISEQRRRLVEPSEFPTLKRGGELVGKEVESIAYLGGQRFNDGMPFKRLTFKQS